MRKGFLTASIRGHCISSTLPNIEGRETSKGPAYHTARWPHEEVDFQGSGLES